MIRQQRHRARAIGLTLVELLTSLAIATLLMAGLSTLVSQALQSQSAVIESNGLHQQAQFALERMTAAVARTHRLLLPLDDNPATNWREHVREQWVPAQPPEGDSVLATAVLAVALDHRRDFDRDGWSDANDDKDYVDLNNNLLRDPGEPERIDEDPGADLAMDDAAGLIGIDDNGDGYADDTTASPPEKDDDEDDLIDEDGPGGGDVDGDGSLDEDAAGDNNGDGAPGLAGIDDDGDGITDEGSAFDDDEDGASDEDSINPVVYYLSGSQLMERMPSLSDSNGDAVVNGQDFSETVIAESVSYFRVEKVPLSGARAQLVAITLELSTTDGNNVRLDAQVRMGEWR